MRTTVKIDPDLFTKLKSLAAKQGVSFREALNKVLRVGLGAQAESSRQYKVPTKHLGLKPGIDLDKALSLAYALEDEETLRKIKLRK